MTLYRSVCSLILIIAIRRNQHGSHHGKRTKCAGNHITHNIAIIIFAWTGALKKRGELDSNAALSDFAEKLEKACIKTIEDGKMTKDLALITTNPNPVVLNSEDFIKAIRTTLEESLK